MKKILCLALTVVILMTLGFAIPAEAVATSETGISVEQEEYIKNYACDQVVQAYSDYYVIPSISAEILSTVIDDPDVISAKVYVSFTKVLKAESAYDLPYIQGLQAGLSELTNSDEIARVEAYLNMWVNELEGLYIGQDHTESAEFCVEVPRATAMTYSLSDPATSIYYLEAFSRKPLSMDEFRPETEDDLHASGVLDALEMADSAPVAAPMSVSSAPSSPTDYDRIAARTYAQTWVCGRSDCNRSCYNPEYSSFSSDCANFVSQCIYAGGIQREPGVWAPYTTPWCAVRYVSQNMGICEYMVDRGYFFDAGSSPKKAFAGSIISWLGYGHVGLVDYNDTVDMTFCAHTDDMLSQKFPSGVKFYIPVWDSYAGCYTPR